MFAEDCNVFINSTVNITCKLNETYKGANFSTLYFERDKIPLENEHITVVNQTTVVLQHVITIDDQDNNIYCRTTTHASYRLGKIEFVYIDCKYDNIIK